MAMEIGKTNLSNLQASFVDKISAIKENRDEASNALISDTVIKVEISALGEEELEKVRQSWDTKPSSALYSTDIPTKPNADGVYKIGKADFSEDEFKAAKSLVTGMTDQLKKGTLDYKDYTKMTLAENLVGKCAANSFSDEQREVIVKAVKDYNERLMSHNNELLSKSNYVESDDENGKQYWGLKQVIPDAAKDAMKKLFGKSPIATTAVTSVATNKMIIESLQKKAKEVDVTDKDEMDEFRSFYQTTMGPVYDAHYPEKMRSDSNATIELDLNGAEGISKMVEFAKQWLDNN